ncbi:MAG: nickel pincer cofactor biosynthesis protein LarB [Chloroflexi bacterium]|nr:nickel pincer cofactor biosynthesis protein LarB [Chloroflexota bacterium]
MTPESIRKLLEQVRSGEVGIDGALSSLRSLPFEDLGFARLDHHRALRTGYPEVVFCQGKTADHVAQIMQALTRRGSRALGTRASLEQFEAVQAVLPDAIYHTMARIIVAAPDAEPNAPIPNRFIGIVSAGTADMPVAEEAAITAMEMGSIVRRFYDIGVAGIHRLLDNHSVLCEASALVVVAGMEGALASVVGGLVPCPVVAVPTSIGYGASFGGLAALLSMLNTCATGVAVVNIDNGFGGGYYAHLINAASAGAAIAAPRADAPTTS